jgi:hypothetical protein
MLSRARIFAAVAFLASCLAGPAAWAQVQNLEAGKSASQLFAGTCNACHKSPRGLLKTVSPGALTGFLREHYTTSSEMASQLASFLVSNGATDARARPAPDKPGVADQADRQGRRNRPPPGQEAARPDDGSAPGEGGRLGRKRLARPEGPSEEAKPAPNSPPAQAAIEGGPDGRRLKRLGKPRPGTEEPSMATEPPKAETGAEEKAKGGDATTKGEAAKEDKKEELGSAGRIKPDAVRSEGVKSDADAKSNEAKSGPSRMEGPKDNASGEKPLVRRDPMPPVTPAPPAAASSGPSPAPAVASGGTSEPAAPRASAPQAPPPQEPSAVTASAPPPAPPSSGPPAPPISQ